MLNGQKALPLYPKTDPSEEVIKACLKEVAEDFGKTETKLKTREVLANYNTLAGKKAEAVIMHFVNTHDS